MVHPCDKPCGNKTASGYCATTACINPQYSNIGTVRYGKGVQKRIITNADRFRAMSVEEMAVEMTAKGGCPHDCETPDDIDTDCVQCWLDWLREEVSTDG